MDNQPKKDFWNSIGEVHLKMPKFLNESMKQNWNFQRKEGSNKKPSMGVVWIFSETNKQPKFIPVSTG